MGTLRLRSCITFAPALEVVAHGGRVHFLTQTCPGNPLFGCHAYSTLLESRRDLPRGEVLLPQSRDMSSFRAGGSSTLGYVTTVRGGVGAIRPRSLRVDSTRLISEVEAGVVRESDKDRYSRRTRGVSTLIDLCYTAHTAPVERVEFSKIWKAPPTNPTYCPHATPKSPLTYIHRTYRQHHYTAPNDVTYPDPAAAATPSHSNDRTCPPQNPPASPSPP